MPITAHATCTAVVTSTSSNDPGWAEVAFRVDRPDERNAEWQWEADPRFALGLKCTAEVAARFEHGQSYTITIAEEA